MGREEEEWGERGKGVMRGGENGRRERTSGMERGGGGLLGLRGGEGVEGKGDGQMARGKGYGRRRRGGRE